MSDAFGPDQAPDQQVAEGNGTGDNGGTPDPEPTPTPPAVTGYRYRQIRGKPVSRALKGKALNR